MFFYFLNPNSQINLKKPREDSINGVLKSFLDLNIDVLNAATNNRHVDGNDIRLVNLGPIALFSGCKLTSSLGKHSKDINHAQIVCLMYKLITLSRRSDDLSISLDRSHDRRQRELTNNKNIKRNYYVRI